MNLLNKVWVLNFKILLPPSWEQIYGMALYIYRAVWCVRAPKGSVVNFTAYQNRFELILIILKYIEVLSLWSLSGFRYNF
jgi:hypothetical protein